MVADLTLGLGPWRACRDQRQQRRPIGKDALAFAGQKEADERGRQIRIPGARRDAATSSLVSTRPMLRIRISSNCTSRAHLSFAVTDHGAFRGPVDDQRTGAESVAGIACPPSQRSDNLVAAAPGQLHTKNGVDLETPKKLVRFVPVAVDPMLSAPLCRSI